MQTINPSKKSDFRYESATAINKLNIYENEINNGLSEREAAKKSRIPRSTLRDFSRINENNFSTEVVEFIITNEGFNFLHRLFVTMMLQFVILGSCGIRQFCIWLKISGLSNFIASSYGTWREFILNMEEKILTFEKVERQTLSRDMPEKKISLAVDESFFKEMCLVGIEPISKFIFVEKFSEKRDAESWYSCITSNNADLRVKIVQIVGDQASGIISLAKNMFSAHYATDLFHVQREICKAGSLTIASKVNLAEENLEKQTKNLEKIANLKTELDIEKKSTDKIDLKIKNEVNKLKNFQTIADESRALQKKFNESLLGISSLCTQLTNLPV
ncbi:MAG: hypothetical protein V4591_11470 [Bdellovibrionota bacterium]